MPSYTAKNVGGGTETFDAQGVGAGDSGNKIPSKCLKPVVSGVMSTYRNLDLDESPQAISSTACQVYGGWARNQHATDKRYLKLWDRSTAPTVGTHAPNWSVELPVGQTSITQLIGIYGLPVVNKLYAAVTTGFADNDTGAPSTNDVSVHLEYRN